MFGDGGPPPTSTAGPGTSPYKAKWTGSVRSSESATSMRRTGVVPQHFHPRYRKERAPRLRPANASENMSVQAGAAQLAKRADGKHANGLSLFVSPHWQ
jgi:hypothetical protein